MKTYLKKAWRGEIPLWQILLLWGVLPIASICVMAILPEMTHSAKGHYMFFRLLVAPFALIHAHILQRYLKLRPPKHSDNIRILLWVVVAFSILISIEGVFFSMGIIFANIRGAIL